MEASSALVGVIDWPYHAQVCRITRTRWTNGKVETETAYAVTSVMAEQASPKVLLGYDRGHWSIENKLHYVRDTTMNEDKSTVRMGSLPQVMAAMRNAVLYLLRRSGAKNMAAALRSNAANFSRAFALLSSNLHL